jgi:hypothetical protein
VRGSSFTLHLPKKARPREEKAMLRTRNLWKLNQPSGGQIARCSRAPQCLMRHRASLLLISNHTPTSARFPQAARSLQRYLRRARERLAPPGTYPPSLTTARFKHNIGPSVVLACKALITISGTGDHHRLEFVITIVWND